jgi:hypothetical protein
MYSGTPPQWAPCTGCGEVVQRVDNAIAEAQECLTLNQVADAFADVERFDCRVNEVFVRPDVLFELRKDTNDPVDWGGGGLKIGKDGESNAFLWGAKVRIHAPPGKMLVWNEEEILD